MYRIKVLLVGVCAIISAMNASAQLKKKIDYSGFFDTYYYPNIWEFSAGIGLPLYYGDLCGGAGCNDGNLSLVIGAAYKPWPKVAFEADFYYTTLSAQDINKTRNISFKSKNYEIAAYGKYFFRDDIIRRHQDMFKKTKVFKPYGLIGISGLYYNPETYLTNETTGVVTPVSENATYPRLGMAIPGGIGAEFDFSRRFAIVVEMIYRYGFTDLLDGVSEIYGNPDVKDSYLTFDLKVQWSPWAPRTKKKKIGPPKEVPQYDFSVDSTKTAGATGKTNATPKERDEEMDYYDQLMKDADDANKTPADDYYYDEETSDDDDEEDGGYDIIITNPDEKGTKEETYDDSW